jgi:hypothetical protein
MHPFTEIVSTCILVVYNLQRWATHTGRYTENMDKDYPKWKARLRCAMNKAKEDFEFLREEEDSTGTPYKIYRFKRKPGICKHDLINYENN